MFAAAHSIEFQPTINKYRKKGSQLSVPEWRFTDDAYWKEQCPNIDKGAEVVHAIAKEWMMYQIV
jgi:hypothetical protein